MEFNELKEYIETIKDTERFKKLDNFTRMTQIRQDQGMYESILYYITIYHPIRNVTPAFQPNHQYVKTFLQHYMENEPANMQEQSDGYIDLTNTLYLVQPRMYSGGRSFDGL